MARFPDRRKHTRRAACEFHSSQPPFNRYAHHIPQARVNRKNGNGTPPVILAAKNHQLDLVRWMVDYFGNDINCVRVNNTNLLNACIESGFPVELCRKVRDQFPELEKSLAGGILNPHEIPCLVFARSGRLIPDDFLHNRSRQYDGWFHSWT